MLNIEEVKLFPLMKGLVHTIPILLVLIGNNQHHVSIQGIFNQKGKSASPINLKKEIPLKQSV